MRFVVSLSVLDVEVCLAYEVCPSESHCRLDRELRACSLFFVGRKGGRRVLFVRVCFRRFVLFVGFIVSLFVLDVEVCLSL